MTHWRNHLFTFTKSNNNDNDNNKSKNCMSRMEQFDIVELHRCSFVLSYDLLNIKYRRIYNGFPRVVILTNYVELLVDKINPTLLYFTSLCAHIILALMVNRFGLMSAMKGSERPFYMSSDSPP